MRLTKFLIDGYPRLKCGPAAIIPLAAASTVAQVGSAAMTNAANAEIASNQLGVQREENKLNRDWQTEEAEKNRAFQTGTMQVQQAYTTSERLASQDYQAQQWQRQFEQELSHRFDVPDNANPAVYFSSHGAASGVGGSVSAPSGNTVGSPSGSMPGTVQGLSPVPYQAQRLDFAQLLSGAGNFVSSLANAKKAGAETTDIMENLSAKVRKGIADADSAEMIAALNQLHLHIQKSNLPWSLKMAELDYQQALAKIDLTKKEALTQGEQAALHVATAKMNSALSEYYSKEGQKSDITLRYLPDMLKSEILSNRASAEESRAVAQNQLSLSDKTQLEKIIMRNTQSGIEERVLAELDNLKKEGKILDAQERQVLAAAREAEVAADHAEELFWKDFMIDIISEGSDAIIGFKNARSWSRMSDASQRRVDAKIREIDNKYGDKVELQDERNGVKRKRIYQRPSQRYGK